MLKNYIKIAWRNITKNKIFSLINIVGLTIGLSASFVIGLIIYYDATYDTFHPDDDRIYRVVSDFYSPSGQFHNSGVTVALRDAIADNSNLEKLGNFFMLTPMKVANPETNAEFELPRRVIFADQDYFDIFQYQFLAGSKENAITEPNSVVLSEERANRYFPDADYAEIIGKSIVYDDSINARVTGIVEKLPGRTDIIFEEFVSWPTLLQTWRGEFIKEKNWNSTTSQSQLFVKVSPGANLDNIQQVFDQLSKEQRDAESIKLNNTRKFGLQPLGDIHFNGDYGIYDWERGQSSKTLLWNLGLVAVFLLLLGCINFVNLNTAQATQRAKEIGIRKTLGSSRKQLMAQFMGETFLLVLISAFLSFVMCKWLLEVFSDFVPNGLDFGIISSPWIIGGMVVLLVIVTFLSGFYPAMVLSRYNTVSVLKNNLTMGDKKAKLRKTLTVFQFSIAQIFIIATLLVGKQINFVMATDMGFQTESIVSIYHPITARKLSKLELLAQQVSTVSEVRGVSIANNPPASFSTNVSDMTRKIDSSEMYKDVYILNGDTNYTDVFEINILAGTKRRNDTVREMLLNETAIKAFGWENPQDAVGQVLEYNGQATPIVGVMEDFHQWSLRGQIEPMALTGNWFLPDFNQYQSVSMAISPDSDGSIASTISKIEAIYYEVYPDTEMRLQFMDETVESFYNSEKKVSTLLKWATGLSILISCLGLLGLVIYTTNRRIKEIGVRKVLGASVLQINTLLCKEFVVLVGIAFLVAAPLAYYGVYEWLKDFAYKTGISWWIFVLSGLSMIVFALIVMSIKTIQAANSNPVNSLRSE